jgi:hypothetical protein
MAGGARSGSGRKRIKIDLAELEKLCALQCTDDEIASFFGVSPRTVERRKKQPAFAEAVARGKARGRLSLRRSLWGLAVKGNPAANIFLSKNLLGYKDVLSNEHSGPDGGPIQFSVLEALQRRRNHLAEQRKLTDAATQAPANKPKPQV